MSLISLNYKQNLIHLKIGLQFPFEVREKLVIGVTEMKTDFQS